MNYEFTQALIEYAVVLCQAQPNKQNKKKTNNEITFILHLSPFSYKGKKGSQVSKMTGLLNQDCLGQLKLPI